MSSEARGVARRVTLVTAPALAFALLAWAIAAGHGAPFRIDVALHDWATGHRPTLAVAGARLVTATAGGPLPYLAAFYAGWIACSPGPAARRKAAVAVAALLALASGELVRTALMVAFARSRPSLADWAASASGHAFPSGHATTSAVVAGLLIWAALRTGPRVAVGIRAALCGGWAAAVGAARVYLGMHWPTDVLGGWQLAGLRSRCRCSPPSRSSQRQEQRLKAAADDGGRSLGRAPAPNHRVSC